MPGTPFENDESLLVAAVIKGDKGAFRLLIVRNEKLVVSIVFKMITQREDCEDLCQDIFLKVYEKLPTFRFQSKLSTWIGSIAFNMCINFLQKRKLVFLDDIKNPEQEEIRTEENSNLSFRDPGRKPDEILMDKEKEELLLKSIERLSILQKTVLELFHRNELSLQEISEVTKLPINTVKSHLFRARKLLKEEMDKY